MNIIKKPPDKYICIKCPLEFIIKDDKEEDIYNKEYILTILNDTCFRTNQIIIHTYQFIRLWILHKYHNKTEIPIIDKNMIKIILSVLSTSSKGGNRPQGENLKLLEDFEKFYQDNYKNLNYDNKVNGEYLTQILDGLATDMLTNIENNIKLHFFKYVNRFVNSSFKKINNELIEKAKEGTKTELRKQLSKDIFEIKQDLTNNTLKSNEKYHKWINTHRNNIFYKDVVNSYEFDIQNNPQRYLKSMIYMCEQIEKLETKLFQFFPLRTDITQKYIPIDTKILVDLFLREDKKKYYDDIETYKKPVWKMFFDIEKSIFKQSNYTFDYKIYTDGYTVSIQMLLNDKVESEKQKKQNVKNKRNENKQKTKGMTKEQKEEFKKNCQEEKKKQDKDFKLKLKEKKDKDKEEFKKLSKEEQNKILEKRKQEIKESKILNGTDFLYLEDLNDKQLDEVKKNEWLVVDPGFNIFNIKYINNNLIYKLPFKTKSRFSFSFTSPSYICSIIFI